MSWRVYSGVSLVRGSGRSLLAALVGMTNVGALVGMTSVAALVGMTLSAAVAGEVPPRTEMGQTLVVPAAQLDLGEVYYAAPGASTQFMWTQDAAALRYVALCNRVVGYLVAPFDLEDDAPPIYGGAFRLPVASLSCGIEANDAAMRSAAGLNAAEFPEVTLLITGVKDAKLINAEGVRRRYELTLGMEFTAHGKTVTVEAPARLTFVPFTWATMNVNLGDFFVLRTSFEVKDADLDIPTSPQPDADLQPVAGTVSLCLVCSTASPEKNIDPRVKVEQFRKQTQFLTLLRDFDDAEKAYALGRKYAQENWDDAAALNRLAWAVLTEAGIQRRDLGFVTELTDRAGALSAGRDGPILNTLARLNYEKGDLTGALEFARRAVEHLEGMPADEAAPIRAALEGYEAAEKARHLREPAPAAE